MCCTSQPSDEGHCHMGKLIPELSLESKTVGSCCGVQIKKINKIKILLHKIMLHAY